MMSRFEEKQSNGRSVIVDPTLVLATADSPIYFIVTATIIYNIHDEGVHKYYTTNGRHILVQLIRIYNEIAESDCTGT